MPTLQNTLNENQRAAVHWQAGSLLVLAGPGSGKTAVLTYRIAHLIQNSIGKRFRVLALTFTNRAAIEMRDRLNEVCGEGSERALLTTFHSFAADILRQHGSHIGLSPDFAILNNEEDRIDILREAIQKLSRNDDAVDESDVGSLPLLTNLIEKLIPPNSIEGQFRDGEIGRKVRLLYDAYRAELLEHNTLDFVSLIALAHELLCSNPGIAKHYQTIYPYVCVDEFQDTNLGQYQLLRDVVGSSPTGLFVVADDDQIVYQWNGASPERLQEIQREYKMQVLQLPENYRCPEQIIAVANKLIAHNPSHSSQKQPLQGKKNGRNVGEPIELRKFETAESEISWVAERIAKLPSRERGDSVVLARTRSMVEKAAAALDSLGVPYTLSVKKNDFVSAPLRWLHSMLRLANSRGDREQLRRVCKAFYELEGIDLRVPDVSAAAAVDGGDFLRAWLSAVESRAGSLDPEVFPVLKEARLSLADRLIYKPFVKLAFNWFDFLQRGDSVLGKTETGEIFADYDEEKQVWIELSDAIAKRFGDVDLSLNVLLQEIDLSPKQAVAPVDAVRCYTIHTAKGMEFDHVFLVGMAEDILPSYQSIKKGPASREMQEERRSCFVAITRVRRSLHLTYARRYSGYEKSPSRFLKEMGLQAQ
jgi:DNA helicase-2/ATP-dependent DNA helicase PcrA